MIHQNKQGIDGKKRSEGQAGRNSLRLNNMLLTHGRVGYHHARFKLFSYLDFPICYARILQNPSK